MDEHGGTVLLRSFSKVSFPGLRVGWAVGPKPLIDRLRQAKEASDLHTDQLSQAVLLEFAESGRLEAHRARVLRAGAERLAATLDACRELPAGRRALDAARRRHERVGAAARAAGCGRAVCRARRRKAWRTCRAGTLRYRGWSRARLRLSFAGLTPEQIRSGLAILGRIVAERDWKLLRELRARVGDGVMFGFGGQAVPAANRRFSRR